MITTEFIFENITYSYNYIIEITNYTNFCNTECKFGKNYSDLFSLRYRLSK